MYSETRLSHIGFMTHAPDPNDGNRIADARKAKGVTQQELADRLGIHSVTMSKLERGKMQLTTKWINRIAEALGVDAGEIWTPTSYEELIFLAGGIAAGGIQDWNVEKQQRYSFKTEDFFDQSSYWIGVSDDSLAPFFHWGDALKFTIYEDVDFGMCVNRLALVLTHDGRQLIGAVERGDESELDLRAPNGLSYKGLKPETFALFTGAFVRKIDDEYFELSQRYSGKRPEDLAK